MCCSYKTNYKPFSKSSSFPHHNYKRSMCPPPAAPQHQSDSLIRPKPSESAFCDRIYCSRDSVCELIQVSG